MAREITQKHIDVALKILGAEKYWRGEVFKNNYEKKMRKIDEMEFCEKLVKRLYEDNQNLKKQPKLI